MRYTTTEVTVREAPETGEVMALIRAASLAMDELAKLMKGGRL